MRLLLCFFLLSACTFVKEDTALNQDTMKVSVVFLDEHSEEFVLPLFSTTQDLLDLINCDECDFSRLNPLSPLHPNDVIVLSEKTENPCISLNQANQSELETLPNIGPSLALRIIDYRTEFGYFQSLEDIMLIKGIKEKLFEKIKAYICL